MLQGSQSHLLYGSGISAEGIYDLIWGRRREADERQSGRLSCGPQMRYRYGPREDGIDIEAYAVREPVIDHRICYSDTEGNLGEHKFLSSRPAIWPQTRG
jgi:hypothetical protein